MINGNIIDHRSQRLKLPDLIKSLPQHVFGTQITGLPAILLTNPEFIFQSNIDPSIVPFLSSYLVCLRY